MTGLWEDIKSSSRKLGRAFAAAAEAAEWEQHRENRRKAAAKEAKTVEKGKASGRYLNRQEPSSTNAIRAFIYLKNAVRLKGQVIADNTPGDSFVIPLTANKGYKVVTALDDARIIRTEYSKGPHPLYEEVMARNNGVGIEGSSAITLKAPGLQVFAVIDDHATPVFLRFDKGNEARLEALQQKLAPQTSTTSPKPI